MKIKVGLQAMALVVSVCLFPSDSIAQRTEAWSEWEHYRYDNDVEVYFRVRKSNNDVRVQWKCENKSDERRWCSLSGAQDKKWYVCIDSTFGRNSYVVGEGYGVREGASVRPNSTYEFVSETTCRGLGADKVDPGVSVKITQE